jgi:hypothetical protein
MAPDLVQIKTRLAISGALCVAGRLFACTITSGAVTVAASVSIIASLAGNILATDLSNIAARSVIAPRHSI